MFMRYKFVALFFIVSTLLLAQDFDKERVKFDPQRNPAEDLKTAVIQAKKQHKKVILDVGGEWCIWCHRIDEFILSHKDIKEYIEKNFIVVKVNYSKEVPNQEFLSNYPKVPGYPHIFVLNSKGKLIHSQDTGDLEKDKSYDADKFMKFLKKAHSAQKLY